MASDFTGVAAHVDMTATVTVKMPDDGDALNVASIENNATVPETVVARFADLAEHYRVGPHQTLLSAAAATWVEVHKWDDTAGAVTPQRRTYQAIDGLLLFVTNAIWTQASAPNGWTQEDGANPSSAILVDGSFGASYSVQIWRKAAGAAAWATWDMGIFRTGSLWATLAAEIAGNITSTGGAVQASAGNVIAAGAPAGDAGPGLVKCKRLYSTGTALVAGQFTGITGFGDTAQPVPGAICRDTAGSVIITCSDAGGGLGYAVNPYFTVTFKDLTWTTAPIVHVELAGATGSIASTAARAYHTGATDTGFTVQMVSAAPVSGDTFKFVWHAIG